MRQLCYLFAISVAVSGFDFVSADDCVYRPEFLEDVGDCSDFTNKDYTTNSLNAKLISDEKGMGLDGAVSLQVDLTSGTDIEMEVAKESDFGKEPMFRTSGDACKSIEEENTPWEPLFKAMNITGCPIKAGKYDVKDMLVDLGFAQGVLTHQNIGEYEVIFRLVQDDKTVACFLIMLSVTEICE